MAPTEAERFDLRERAAQCAGAAVAAAVIPVCIALLAGLGSSPPSAAAVIPVYVALFAGLAG